MSACENPEVLFLTSLSGSDFLIKLFILSQRYIAAVTRDMNGIVKRSNVFEE